MSKREQKLWVFTGVPALLKNTDSGIYYSRPKVGGKQKFQSLYTRSFGIAKRRHTRIMAMTERQREKIRARKSAGEFFDDSVTLSFVIEVIRGQTEIEHGLKPAGRASRLNSLNFLEQSFPKVDAQIKDISENDCREWAHLVLTQGRVWRAPGSKGPERKPASASTFNRSLALLRQCFALAIEQAVILEDPSRKIKRAKNQPRSPTLPSREDFRRIMHAMEHNGPKGMRMASGIRCRELCEGIAFSGMRIGEASALRWQNVNFEEKYIDVPGTKTEAALRRIPLFPDLEKLLLGFRVNPERKGEQEDTYVFQVRTARKALPNACERLGLPRLTHHDLRDYFATVAIESGIDIRTVAGWLGHADGGALLLRRYAHLRDQHSREAMHRLKF